MTQHQINYVLQSPEVVEMMTTTSSKTIEAFAYYF